MDELRRGRATRRELLGLIGGLGAAAFAAGCGGGSSAARRAVTTLASGTTTSTTAATAPTAAVLASCTKIPEETAGPYPGDGSNGPNVLTQSGVVRGDIRSSIGSASGVASGVPLTVKVTLVDPTNGCKPRSGAAVYLWHCDINEAYSLYSQGA